MFQPLIWKKFYNPRASNEHLLSAVCGFTAKLLPPRTHTYALLNLRNVNEEVYYIFIFFLFYLLFILYIPVLAVFAIGLLSAIYQFHLTIGAVGF